MAVGQANPTIQLVKKPHFVHKLSSLSEPITFKVWSANDAGSTENYSRLVIPGAKRKLVWLLILKESRELLCIVIRLQILQLSYAALLVCISS